MPGYSLLSLLERHPDPSRLHDPLVSSVVKQILGPSKSCSDIDIAGACLGHSYEAVERLVEDGSLPDLLPETSREELRDRIRSRTLDATTLAANKEIVAQWLGLPAGITTRHATIPTMASADYSLFAHQRAALRETSTLVRQGERRALIHMPTGSGKTRTAMNLVSMHLRESEPSAVLWIASTNELCEQAAQEFLGAWRFLGDRELQILAGWGGRNWDPEDINDGLIICTPQTLNSRKQGHGARFLARLGERLSLILFDEAHQAIAPTFKDVVEHLAATGAGKDLTPIIGLTATPGRTFVGSDSDYKLADFFGQTKIRLNTTLSGGPANPVEYLISEGYLADPTFELLLPEGAVAPPSALENVSFEAEDSSRIELDPAEYLTLVTRAILDLLDRGHARILVFAASVELADQLASVVRALDIRAESVTGQTPREVRAGMIARYRADTDAARVLINFGVLTTGFDAPSTSAAVIARPTRSLVLYSQMVGRAIRGPRAGGNANATIVTVVDPGIPAFGSIAHAFLHWEELWND